MGILLTVAGFAGAASFTHVKDWTLRQQPGRHRRLVRLGQRRHLRTHPRRRAAGHPPAPPHRPADRLPDVRCSSPPPACPWPRSSPSPNPAVRLAAVRRPRAGVHGPGQARPRHRHPATSSTPRSRQSIAADVSPTPSTTAHRARDVYARRHDPDATPRPSKTTLLHRRRSSHTATPTTRVHTAPATRHRTRRPRRPPGRRSSVPGGPCCCPTPAPSRSPATTRSRRPVSAGQRARLRHSRSNARPPSRRTS